MGIMNWIKSCKKPQRHVKCPNCGSDNIEYSSMISNYVDVIMYSKDATYKTDFKCLDCGHKETTNE